MLAKFGLFFMLTISFSYLWSVLFLMPLLATIGPRSECPPHAETERDSSGSSSRAVADTAVSGVALKTV